MPEYGVNILHWGIVPKSVMGITRNHCSVYFMIGKSSHIINKSFGPFELKMIWKSPYSSENAFLVIFFMFNTEFPIKLKHYFGGKNESVTLLYSKIKDCFCDGINRNCARCNDIIYQSLISIRLFKLVKADERYVHNGISMLQTKLLCANGKMTRYSLQV